MATTTTQRRRYKSIEQAHPEATKTRLSTIMLIAALAVALLGVGLVVQMMLTRVPIVTLGQEVKIGGLSLMVEQTGWLSQGHGSHGDDEDEAQNSDGQGDGELQQLAAQRSEEIEDLTAQGQVFPMPDNMMPDMPLDGQQRLQVEFILQNLSEQSRDFGAEEFQLHSVSGETWSPRVGGSSFRAGTLQPGQALSAVIFFDVDETATELYLIWNRDGSQVRVPVDTPISHDDY